MANAMCIDVLINEQKVLIYCYDLSAEVWEYNSLYGVHEA